jgi:tetratricopeptide (TPR) repeat protein
MWALASPGARRTEAYRDRNRWLVSVTAWETSKNRDKMQKEMCAGPRLFAIAVPLFAAITLGSGACPGAPADPGGSAPSPVQPGQLSKMRLPKRDGASAEVRPLRRCFPELPAWVDLQVDDLLDRAGANQDDDDFQGVLACAEEAARQAPRSVEAHHNRALALMRLGRFEEARDALALALAIAPDDGECLELAAELYINRLPPSAERTGIGLEYAQRGRRTLAGRNRLRAARLALLEGQALVDLGRAAQALTPLRAARMFNKADLSARYEQGVANFELCRFVIARKLFEDVLAKDPGHAHARYHLALIKEREGKEPEADQMFKDASARDPKSFPVVPDISAPEFERRVRAATVRLPLDVQRDLEGIPIESAEIPAVEDLTAERPPLSPTILGLFRGLPLGREQAVGDAAAVALRGTRGRQARVTAGSPSSESEGRTGAHSSVVPARAIVLYRRNILRSVHGTEELDRAIERTLLHEVGHLRGEDDGSLRDRGLE